VRDFRQRDGTGSGRGVLARCLLRTGDRRGATSCGSVALPLRIFLAGGGTDLPRYADRFGGTVVGSTIDLRVTVVGKPGTAGPGIRVCLDVCGRGGARTRWPTRSPGRRSGGTGTASRWSWRPSATCRAVRAGQFVGLLRRPDRRAGGRPAEPGDHRGGRQRGRDPRPRAAGRTPGPVPVGPRRLPGAAFSPRRRRVRGHPGAGRLRPPARCRTAAVLHRLDARRRHGTKPAERRPGGRPVHPTSAARDQGAGPRRPGRAGAGDADTVGEVLGRHWEIKRTLGAAVAPGQVDRAYADARAAGATGGKLPGAGGGGFLLVHAPDAARDSVRTTLSAHGFVERAFRVERRGVELNRVGVPAGAAPADLSLRPS